MLPANGATATFGWEGMKRQTSQTLPSGQVINHEYGLGQGPGASWHKVPTGLSPNFRWTKTVFDGFGRTLEVISGHKVGSTETAVSKVVTEYTPCACSSIGKVKRTSMPFAASASPLHWTASDALGNLIPAWEPPPGGGADSVTSDAYTRPGKGVGSPATATQTENGMTLYEYFDDGSSQKKTDAKRQRWEWTYDAVGRPVTGKRFSSPGVADVCARVTTTSRSQGLDGSFPIGPRRAG